jgi:F0F1-type ATP synthase membrane subunit b/b'
MDKLDEEIAEIKDQLRKEGETQGDRIIERGRQAIERIREDTKFQADQQVKMARKTLQEEAARLAVEAAEEILKKSVNDKDHDRLVGQFLREVK